MARFRKDLKVFERYEMHTRLLGWDDKWIFMEHRFVRGGRVAGLFHARRGPMAPSALLAAMNMVVESPPLPDWLAAWNASCDALAAILRAEEGGPGPL